MLSLTSKPPRELCLMIFEFSMAAEEVAIDATVFDLGGDGSARPEKALTRNKYMIRTRF